MRRFVREQVLGNIVATLVLGLSGTVIAVYGAVTAFWVGLQGGDPLAIVLFIVLVVAAMLAGYVALKAAVIRAMVPIVSATVVANLPSLLPPPTPVASPQEER